MANQQDASFHIKTEFPSRNGVLDYCAQRHKTGIIIIIIIIVVVVVVVIIAGHRGRTV
jgi:hypothetical protein